MSEATENNPTAEQEPVAAILRQLIMDIRQPNPGKYTQRALPSLADQLNCIEWLLSGEELAWFAALLNLDEAWLQEQLMVQAGAVDATPRLGERKEPLPKPVFMFPRKDRIHQKSTNPSKKGRNPYAIARTPQRRTP